MSPERFSFENNSNSGSGNIEHQVPRIRPEYLSSSPESRGSVEGRPRTNEQIIGTLLSFILSHYPESQIQIANIPAINVDSVITTMADQIVASDKKSGKVRFTNLADAVKYSKRIQASLPIVGMSALPAQSRITRDWLNRELNADERYDLNGKLTRIISGESRQTTQDLAREITANFNVDGLIRITLRDSARRR